MTDEEKKEEKKRIKKANELIKCIASVGRQFFRYEDEISFFTVNRLGHTFLYDPFSKKMVYTRYKGRWPGFSQGGTMRNLVIALTNYIKKGTKLSREHFWFPKWACSGDVWGYHLSMEDVRKKVIELDLIE